MPEKLGMHAKPFLSESAWSQCPKRLGMHAKPNSAFGRGFRVFLASFACQAWTNMSVMAFLRFWLEYILSTHPLRRCSGLRSAAGCCDPRLAIGGWSLAVPGCAKLLLLLLLDAAAGRGWLVLDATGCCWLLLAAAGCCWQLLIFAGCCRLLTGCWGFCLSPDLKEFN